MTKVSSDRQIKRLKSQANRLPNKPGVYVMSNEHDKVIYVGKAKGLKNIEGIIVGKAIYDGDIKLEELVEEIDA